MKAIVCLNLKGQPQMACIWKFFCQNHGSDSHICRYEIMKMGYETLEGHEALSMKTKTDLLRVVLRPESPGCQRWAETTILNCLLSRFANTFLSYSWLSSLLLVQYPETHRYTTALPSPAEQCCPYSLYVSWGQEQSFLHLSVLRGAQPKLKVQERWNNFRL